jgi:hypothetical protein
MKVTLRLKILLGVLAVLIAVSAVLLGADLLPALAEARERRKELERKEAEIQRSLLEVRLRSGKAGPGEAAVAPELPEIAAFISALRQAQDRCGIKEMTFDASQTERLEATFAAGMSEENRKYVAARLTVAFSSSLEQVAAFLNMVQGDYPPETFDYVKLSSRNTGQDWVDVSMAVRLYGIPR